MTRLERTSRHLLQPQVGPPRMQPRHNAGGGHDTNATRLLRVCLTSLLLYVACFAVLLDRPLTFGFLRHQLDATLTRGAAITGPKLVILAGSNGPYSHRCTVIEPMLRRPCINAGVAVGIGLDYLFVRWQKLLHPGDIVYMPMEEAQYVRGRAANALGPDAAIMLRHDRSTLARLPVSRWLGALFCYDLRGAVMALIETALAASGFHDPRATALGETDSRGDHVGHTAAMAAANTATLAAVTPFHPDAVQIRAGFGTTLISGFIDWAQAHGVRVIGGLPTGFVDSPLPDASVAAIRMVYTTHGALFLELPNRSRYPRTAFFDTADHLNETWQAVHSTAVARGLAEVLQQTEAQCPSVMAGEGLPSTPFLIGRCIVVDGGPSPAMTSNDAPPRSATTFVTKAPPPAGRP